MGQLLLLLRYRPAVRGYLDVLGVYRGRLVRKGVTYALRFVIVNEPGQPAFLGLPACNHFFAIFSTTTNMKLQCRPCIMGCKM
jgi:hypothetical protein